MSDPPAGMMVHTLLAELGAETFSERRRGWLRNPRGLRYSCSGPPVRTRVSPPRGPRVRRGPALRHAVLRRLAARGFGPSTAGAVTIHPELSVRRDISPQQATR